MRKFNVSSTVVPFEVLCLKRFIDIVGSLILLAISSPLLLGVAIAVKWTSRGPILYRQIRVGQHGRNFELLKFRSMREDAEKECGAIWAQEAGTDVDPRVTPVGNFLRKSHLDELPQLWLVLMGVMSFIGPRPERPEFVENLEREYLYFDERHTSIKPGISGIAQVEREVDEAYRDTGIKLIADYAYTIRLSQSTIWTYWLLDIPLLFGTAWNILYCSKRFSFPLKTNHA